MQLACVLIYRLPELSIDDYIIRCKMLSNFRATVNSKGTWLPHINDSRNTYI